MAKTHQDERLLDYLYDEMSAEERAAFERDMAANPELAAQVESYGALRTAVREVPDAEPPQPALDAIMRAARQEAAVATERARDEGLGGWWGRFAAALMRPAVATAVVFVLFVGAGLLFLRDGADKALAPRSAEPVAPATPVSVTGGARSSEAADEPKSEPAPLPVAAEAPAEETVTTGLGGLLRNQRLAGDGRGPVAVDKEQQKPDAAKVTKLAKVAEVTKSVDAPAASAGKKAVSKRKRRARDSYRDEAQPAPKPKPKAEAKKLAAEKPGLLAPTTDRSEQELDGLLSRQGGADREIATGAASTGGGGWARDRTGVDFDDEGVAEQAVRGAPSTPAPRPSSIVPDSTVPVSGETTLRPRERQTTRPEAAVQLARTEAEPPAAEPARQAEEGEVREETGGEEQKKEAPEKVVDEDLRAGDEAFAAGRHDEAARRYKTFLSRSGKASEAPRAQLQMARALAGAGRVPEALEAYESLLRSHPSFWTNAAVIYELATVQGRLGLLEPALDNAGRIATDPVFGTRARALERKLRAADTATRKTGAKKGKAVKKAATAPSKKSDEPKPTEAERAEEPGAPMKAIPVKE